MTHPAALAANEGIVSAHGAVLAAGGNILNTAGATAILVTIFGLSVLTLAIRAAMHAHRSNFGAVITMLGILALAAMFYSLATGGQVAKLGGDLVHQFLNI